MKARVEYLIKPNIFLCARPDLAQNCRHEQLIIGGSYTEWKGNLTDGQLSLTLCIGVCRFYNPFLVLPIPYLLALYLFTVCCPLIFFTLQPTQISKESYK